MEVLIDAGANVDAINNITGATPLHCAIQSSKVPEKRVQVVRLLLERGKANASLGDSKGAIPYDYCGEQDFELKQLLRPATPPIFQAIANQDLNKAREILHQQPSAVESQYFSKSPLVYLIDRFIDQANNNNDEQKLIQLEIMEMLLQNGSDPNVSAPASFDDPSSMQGTEPSDPPLYQIFSALKETFQSDPEGDKILTRAASILLEHGATPTEAAQFLAHDAARRGKTDFLAFLVRTLKMDINTPGRQGLTPMHFAARSGQTKTVQFMLESYPELDLHRKDDQGKSALDYAIANHREESVRLLQEKMSSN